MLTVKTGPYTGWTGDSLLDLLDYQAERMATCQHTRKKDIIGRTRGSGIDRKLYDGWRCLDCGIWEKTSEILWPNIPQQREDDQAYWERLREIAKGAAAFIRPGIYVVEAYVSWYGWLPLTYHERMFCRSKSAALARAKECFIYEKMRVTTLD